MRNLPYLFLPILLLLMFGCAGSRVYFDYDPQIDFQAYKTFDWVRESERSPRDADVRNPGSNPFIMKRLMAEVESELSQKGYQRQTEGRPDLLLNFQTKFRRKEDVYIYSSPGYVHWRRGRRVIVDRRNYVAVDRYQEGTLVLDIIDRASKQLIWQGWATDIIGSRRVTEEQLRVAVVKMLENFPPPAGTERR